MDPQDQLWGAIGAVFGSWMNPRAKTYRRLHEIPADWGTAVNVQAMVFGNMGTDCATGVCFTRDPSTGENLFYGEFLVNAQGEDVVAGIRTPQPLSSGAAPSPAKSRWNRRCPAAYADLVAVRATLEKHYRDMQDIEFTVQQNKLYMLQTRSGKRTTAASLRIAVDMANEGLIDRDEAIRRINPAALDQLHASHARSQGAPHAAEPRPAGQRPVPRRARSCSQPTRPRCARHQGRGGDPGAHRDQPRGHPRHARGARHPDHARRHDQPRGRGGARHGPALRRRRRRHRRGLRRARR